MKKRIPLFLLSGISLLLTACGTPGVKTTGVNSDSAVQIAQSSPQNAHDNFAQDNRSDWDNERKCWFVELDDVSGYYGRVYKIDRSGQIIASKAVDYRILDDDYWPEMPVQASSRRSN
jgi:hypothetical protein